MRSSLKALSRKSGCLAENEPRSNGLLTEPLQAAHEAVIDCDALRIHRGDGPAGPILRRIRLVNEGKIHITVPRHP